MFQRVFWLSSVGRGENGSAAYHALGSWNQTSVERTTVFLCLNLISQFGTQSFKKGLVRDIFIVERYGARQQYAKRSLMGVFHKDV